MSVYSAAPIAVSTSAVPVLGTTGLGGLWSVKLKNSGTNPITLGGSGVTATTGYLMAGGDTLSVDVEGDDALYAISALGSTLQVLALGKELGG